MKTISICVVSYLGLAAPVTAQQGTTATPVTNLVQVLPYIEHFAKSLDLEMPLPITTNRVTRFREFGRVADVPHTFSVLVDDRFGFSFDVNHHLVDTFSDKKCRLALMTQKPISPDAMKAMSTPSSITEGQALKMAGEYLARLGYDVKRLPVASSQIVQERPFHWFTIEWTWTRDPVEWVLKEKPRPLFKMEIDGLHKKVSYFITLIGWRAADSLTNFPSAKVSLTNSPSVTSPRQ
jgi:hypothetical protein